MQNFMNSKKKHNFNHLITGFLKLIYTCFLLFYLCSFFFCSDVKPKQKKKKKKKRKKNEQFKLIVSQQEELLFFQLLTNIRLKVFILSEKKTIIFFLCEIKLRSIIFKRAKWKKKKLIYDCWKPKNTILPTIFEKFSDEFFFFLRPTKYMLAIYIKVTA